MLSAAKMAGGALLRLHRAAGRDADRTRAGAHPDVPGGLFARARGRVAGLGGGGADRLLRVALTETKINITNAYAGSLAWSNVFARLTHSHPGRVVWLAFNVLIAVMLMAMGVFEALEQVLALYAHLAVAWVGAIVGDLVISKPLGLLAAHHRIPPRVPVRYQPCRLRRDDAGVGGIDAGAPGRVRRDVAAGFDRGGAGAGHRYPAGDRLRYP
ncbi:hypothetical protein ACU4GD_19940 [Cupriavidus basilensis]